MAARPEEFPRSSAAWWAGEAESPVHLVESGGLPFDLDMEEFRTRLLAQQQSEALPLIARELEETGHARDSDEYRLLLRRLLRQHGLD